MWAIAVVARNALLVSRSVCNSNAIYHGTYIYKCVRSLRDAIRCWKHCHTSSLYMASLAPNYSVNPFTSKRASKVLNTVYHGGFVDNLD